jgi:hypothetical protein
MGPSRPRTVECPLCANSGHRSALTRCENLKIIPVARRGGSGAIDASSDPALGAAMDNPVYALGHSDEELERLRVQSRFVEPITRQFFQEAGISTGMRVLDVGSGAGDVAFLTHDRKKTFRPEPMIVWRCFLLASPWAASCLRTKLSRYKSHRWISWEVAVTSWKIVSLAHTGFLQHNPARSRGWVVRSC